VAGRGGTEPAIEVRDNPPVSRFEVMLGGVEAGIAEYRLRQGEIVFTHTEIYPEFRGGRLAIDLAVFALDAARARGLRVVPACSFFRRFIHSHAQYQDLLAERG